MNLELKHIAPYLPYGLKVYLNGEIFTPKPSNFPNNWNDNRIKILGNAKPILIPMEQTDEPIINAGNIKKSFIEIAEEFDDDFLIENNQLFEFTSGYACHKHINFTDKSLRGNLPYFVVKELFRYHFDYFNLIEKGLAVSYKSVGLL